MTTNAILSVAQPLVLYTRLNSNYCSATPSLSTSLLSSSPLSSASSSPSPSSQGVLFTSDPTSPMMPFNLAEMKAAWPSTAISLQLKPDAGKHFHIFVGDLSSDVELHHLREAFSPFGLVLDCKIIRDPQTSKSRGYGFVTFLRKEDAEMAIMAMNGQWLCGRAIRTNWASRKPMAPSPKDTAPQKPLIYDEVLSQTSATNSTVYCGGILDGLTEDLIQKTFGGFGLIQEIRLFKDKGYAFIRFSSKETAAKAIVAVHGSEVNGHSVRCSWGKEPTAESAQVSPALLQSFLLGSVSPSTLTQYASQPLTPTIYGCWTVPQTTYPQLQQTCYVPATALYNYGSVAGLPATAVHWPTAAAAGATTATALPLQSVISQHQAQAASTFQQDPSGLLGFPIAQCN